MAIGNDKPLKDRCKSDEFLGNANVKITTSCHIN